MKKKKYIKPMVSDHNITMRIIMEETSNKPGHGYGDDNHGHDGPPGQNKDNEDETYPIKERNVFQDGLW